MQEKLKYVDVLKGLGIISVVVGHVCDAMSAYIYAFHMPLFFILGGYLCSPKEVKSYFYKKIRHLAIPYVSFLFIFTLWDIITNPDINDLGAILKCICRSLYGGVKLGGITGVFWFVSVYFITQQLFNVYVSHFNIKKWHVVLLIMIAYIPILYKMELPLNVQVVPMALLFWTIGYLLKKIDLVNHVSKTGMALSVAFMIIMYPICKYVKWDMKYTEYNIPIVGVLSAMLFFISIAFISCCLSRKRKLSLIINHVAYIGTASMSIMFIHQFVHFFMQGHFHTSTFITIILSLYIPLWFYYILYKGVFYKLIH